MKAFLIYDNFLSAARTNAALNHSVEKSELKIEWDIRPWRMDMLRFPPLAEEALADALNAHVLILANGYARMFPFWLEDWSVRRHFSDAVLALMPDAAAAGLAGSQPERLIEFAGKHGLDVICSSLVGPFFNSVAPLAGLEQSHATEVAVVRPQFGGSHAEIDRGWA